MKPSKWLKWKIGAVGAIGIALLFHEVKASPSFQQAYANAAPAKDQSTAASKTQDPVTDDMHRQYQSGSDGSGSNSTRPRKHRGGDYGQSQGDSGPLFGGPGYQGSEDLSGQIQAQPPRTRTQTRTGRS